MMGADHLVQMEGGRLLNGKNSKKPHDVSTSLGTDGGGPTTRVESVKQPGCRKRGKQQLRWEGCFKRDVRKAEDERWREEVVDREKWEMTTAKAVQQYKN